MEAFKIGNKEYTDTSSIEEMLHSEFDNRKNMASSFFHTLQKAGYIKNATQENREEKLGELIDG